MAKIEPGVYEPRDDIRVFDGAEEDVDEEGSRLPLLIVIALLVLAAFAGVVYLAYTEGVQKGRSDAPRVITAEAGPAKIAPTDGGGIEVPNKGLKIYEQPAPSDEDVADEDSAPPPPTLATPRTATTTTPPPSSPVIQAKPSTAAATTAAPSPVQTKPAPSQQVATAAPKALTPAVAKPTPVETKPPPSATAPLQTTAPATTTTVPSAAGSFLVQVGSYPSEADASSAFAAMKAKNSALLSGYSSNVKKVDLGAKGTWYRLRVGPFADKAAAAAAAERLGGGAFPTKP